MEELLAVLVGTGAVVFSPFLIPGLRPVAKSAIKGGMAVADAAKGAAIATAGGYRDVVAKASEALKPPAKATAQEATETAEVPAAGAPAGETGDQKLAARPIDLAPIVTAINKAVQPLTDAAAGMLAQAGKQWNDLIADAQAERKASEVAAVAAAVKVPTAASEPAPAAEGPVMVAAEPVAAEPAAKPAAAAGNELQQIHGIGPKVAALLRDAGIDTLEQLANADVEQLRAVLTSGGARYRVTDPSPWPAEARQLLAAASN